MANQNLKLASGQIIHSSDPNYAEYARQSGTTTVPAVSTATQTTSPASTQAQTTQTAAPSMTPAPTGTPAPTTTGTPAPTNIDPAILAKPGVAALVSSNKVFNEEDARNFAYAKGEANYKQYIGATAGQSNPLYIGETNWTKLQNTYTPYQLQQATIRTKDGIYWKEGVNIGDLPRVDPNQRINDDAKKLADIVSGAKSEADKFTSDAAKSEREADLLSSPELIQDNLMAQLNSQYGGNAEQIYKELFNSPEMKEAQSEVNSLKSKLDEYDQQLEELKDDIRAEVEGEATDSYISALAAVRGDKILRAKRSVQRDYDTALANYNGLKENANNLLNVRVKDADTRYNQLFSMLQLQIQQQGTAFNQDLALNQLALQIPEGRSMTIAGNTVTGLRENDNLNVVQFTDASGKTYVIGMDKKTGQEAYKTYIGTAKVAGSGTTGTTDTTMDLQTALYWLNLSKKKDGTFDLGSIPADIRTGVVNTLSANVDNLPTTPDKRSIKDQIVNWWDEKIW